MIKFAMKNPRTIFEIILIAALILAGWRYNMAQDALQREKDKHATLEEDLQGKITIREGQIEILKRQKDGTVVVNRPYKPPEGSVVIKQKDLHKIHEEYRSKLQELREAKSESERDRIAKDLEKIEDKLNEPDEIIIKDKGFTFKPGYGISVGRLGLKPRLDFKWFYWKRYSGIVGGDPYGLDLSVSRHLDDWLWFRPQNIEVYAGYRPFLFDRDNWAVSFGIRSNF